MSDILTVDQVAELLRCTPETVREKTPHMIPGVKFGRDWVYSRDLVVKAVERESMIVRAMPQGPLPKIPQPTPDGRGGVTKAADVMAYRDKHQVTAREALRDLTQGPPPSLAP